MRLKAGGGRKATCKPIRHRTHTAGFRDLPSAVRSLFPAGRNALPGALHASPVDAIDAAVAIHDPRRVYQLAADSEGLADGIAGVASALR